LTELVGGAAKETLLRQLTKAKLKRPGGDAGTGSEDTISIWEDTPCIAHDQVELGHHEEGRVPAMSRFPFRIRRAYNPK